ncbi:MAG: STAS domain-containing protein [Thermonemataceae bacterium]|nr:STAS domain-containing protein [Thermonemataceae bacterium]
MKNELFEVKKEEKYILLKMLVNKIDASNALEIKKLFISLKEENADILKNIILNLKDVKYVDSSGLSAILVAHKISSELKGLMVLVGVSEHVLKLIKISQLDKVLELLPTEEEAVDAIFMKELEDELGNEENS